MEKTLKIDKKLIALVTFVLLALVWLTCYSSADVTGRIIDAKTDEPIEGAVVVGIWQLESQGFEHSYGKAIHVVESVSDSEGRYRLEGFTLKFAGHLMGSLKNSDPNISVFAEGYRPKGASRDPILERGMGFRRVSPLNGQDIRLDRVALDDRFIAGIWESSIQRVVDAGDCSITSLSALGALLESVEPQCDRFLMERYGMHCKHFHATKKRCEGEQNP